MPKSRRDKKISLTRTTKKGSVLKTQLVDEIRKCVESYARLFVFSVHNMRNSKLKELREEWKQSRFFFGKNKVMAIALGRTAEEEMQPNIRSIADLLRGQCGLLFTNKSKDEVVAWFGKYAEKDFARAGCVATETVSLPAGEISQFAHSMEPQLRLLGMPTALKKGVIILTRDYTVCKAGEVLNPEQARVLKLLGEQMAEFKLNVGAVWSNDGTFEKLQEMHQWVVEDGSGDEELE